jgi:anti-sigma regulatory factor (Ser/Thr protein kinase)
MFVTCLYAVLDPHSGCLSFANAGHNLPYKNTENGVVELRATGMPLGLMPGMTYEEKEDFLAPGESIILFSDGLVEAHNPQGEMFGFPRLRTLMSRHPGGSALIEFLRNELSAFTGSNWEQEDDVTFVTIKHEPANANLTNSLDEGKPESEVAGLKPLAEFSLPSEPGNERQAMERVAEIVRELHLSPATLERLKTAVAEATLNAMEHGNHFQPELPAEVQVLASQKALHVRITDQSGDQPIPDQVTPDLEAKLAGLQSPRGWGLFLIKSMVDEMHITTDKTHHTVELILYLKGEENDQATV